MTRSGNRPLVFLFWVLAILNIPALLLSLLAMLEALATFGSWSGWVLITRLALIASPLICIWCAFAGVRNRTENVGKAVLYLAVPVVIMGILGGWIAFGLIDGQ